MWANKTATWRKCVFIFIIWVNWPFQVWQIITGHFITSCGLKKRSIFVWNPSHPALFQQKALVHLREIIPLNWVCLKLGWDLNKCGIIAEKFVITVILHVRPLWRVIWDLQLFALSLVEETRTSQSHGRPSDRPHDWVCCVDFFKIHWSHVFTNQRERGSVEEEDESRWGRWQREVFPGMRYNYSPSIYLSTHMWNRRHTLR